MKSNSTLIVGCGDLGARVGALLLARGWQVEGIRRDISKIPPGFTSHGADYTVAGSLDFVAALQPEYVLATFNPADRSVEGYKRGFIQAAKNLLAGLGEHRPRHIFVVSSTRVFAQQQGEWVTEESALAVSDPRATAMIEAEQLLLTSGHCVSVVRFAGIYGSSGGRLMSRIAGGELCAAKPARYSNRIHRDDCAGLLEHLLVLADAGRALETIYIGVDDRPAEQYEVESWLARELGVTVSGTNSVVSERVGRGHKRCSNQRLRDSGYELLYPDYRSGYRAVIASTC